MKPQRLPDLPSDLIELALADLEKVEKRKRHYVVDMDCWHSTDRWDGKCAVCFAGGVMAMSLGAKRSEGSGPTAFYGDTRNKLYALNSFREGHVTAGIRWMGIEPPMMFTRIPVHPYFDDPEKFKADMRGIVQYLRSKGL